MKKINQATVIFVLLVMLALALMFYFKHNFLAQFLVMMGLMIIGSFIFLLCETDKNDKEDK